MRGHGSLALPTPRGDPGSGKAGAGAQRAAGIRLPVAQQGAPGRGGAGEERGRNAIRGMGHLLAAAGASNGTPGGIHWR